MSEIEMLNDLVENNESAKPLVDMIQQIMELPEESLNETTIDAFKGAITGAFTAGIREQTIKQMVEEMENNSLTRAEVKIQHEQVINAFNDLINELAPSENKRKLLNHIFDVLFDLMNAAYERFHNYAIDLPIQLEESAQAPTYAHDTDAAADLYALNDTTLPARSYGNVIHTGVRIQLPEGWLAMILPRSSTGKNTPFRLSNSVGLIDSGYRGELMMLFDNTSDNEATITKGSRVAQLLVMPSYRFKPIVVDKLEDSDRGEGGIGSTGA